MASGPRVFKKDNISASKIMPRWSDLPTELLGSILEHLPVPDQVRFACVCSPWRSTAKAKLGQHPPILAPWLMLPSDGSGDGDMSAFFFSLSERRAYRIPQPEPPISDRLCIGSKDGWLVTADDRSELHLLNPITGDQTHLPSVTTLPFINSLDDSMYLLHSAAGEIPPESFTQEQLRYFLYEKAILSTKPTLSTPSSSPARWTGYTVMLLFSPLSKLAFAGAGDDAWTVVDTPSSRWADAIYSTTNGGQFYSLDSTGKVESWDLTGETPTSTTIVRALGTENWPPLYLVEPSAGTLLLIRRKREPACCFWFQLEPRYSYVEFTTTDAEVFKAAAAAEDGWVPETTRLEEYALFLGKNQSLCLPARMYPELRGNCIYFTDDYSGFLDECRCDLLPEMGVLDLKDGSFKPCGGYRSQFVWPPPIWITPTLF